MVRRLYQGRTDPIQVPAAAAIDGAVNGFSAGVPTYIYSFQYQALATTAFVTTTPTINGWWTQWTDPYAIWVGIKAIQARQNFLFFDPSVFVPAPIYTDLPFFARRAAGLLAAQQQFLAFSPLPIVATAGWDDSQEWPRPPTLPGLAAQQQQFLAFSPLPVVATAGWDDGVEWTRPTPRPALPASQQQFLAYSPFVTAAAVNEDSWHQPWSEPVRLKPGLAASQQQSLAYSNFTPATVVTPQIGWQQFTDPIQISMKWTTGDNSYGFIAQSPQVSEDKWHQPWSEPVRTKPGLSTGTQQFAAFVAVVVAAAVVTVDSWIQLWREPPKSKSGLGAANQQFLAFNPAVFVSAPDAWWRPFVEVPKPKSGLAANNQQFLAFTESAPFAETVSEDRWHQPWSEPVRTKQALAASQQLATAYSPFVAATAAPPADGWVNPFGVVPKGKAGLSTANQQFQAFVEAAPFTETVTESRWHQPWSEPIVKSKAGLLTAEQQSLAFAARPPLVSFAYYNRLSEPVRFRRFETAYQVALARNTFVPTPVAGAVMDVTETADVFSGTLYAFNAPVACYVSIIQNDPHISGYAGIIEN